MTEQAAHSAGASIAAPQFDMRPLLVSATVCTVSMMAFVALIGPLARVFDLRPWQAGATVTVSGVLWMVLAPMWGRLSDSRGRRAALLACIAGFAVSYIALCVFVDLALRFHVGAFLAFAGLLISRAAIGAFYAGVPTTSFALVADHTPPEKRASAMAAMGAANRRKAATLYAAIDGSGGFYRAPVAAAHRSPVNVRFHLADDALTEPFLAAAASRGQHHLRGHRQVGGVVAQPGRAPVFEGLLCRKSGQRQGAGE